MFNTQGNGTFKYNLEQGKAILNYNEEVDDIVKPHLKIIQEGSLDRRFKWFIRIISQGQKNCRRITKY